MNTNRFRRVRRPLLGAAAALLLVTAGCFGPNNAARRVHTWNREIENRWVGQLVYLVVRPFVILPCFVGDILIFNSIQFWGWDNPIDPPSQERIQALMEKDAARERGDEEPAAVEAKG